VQLPRHFENECQKIRQEQFFTTFDQWIHEFLRFYLSFLRELSYFYATTTRRCDLLADCHIGGADKQKLFSDSYFVFGKMWKRTVCVHLMPHHPVRSRW
jgi:hypothetical protein